MPRAQVVFCARAEWYSDIAFKILSLPWLAFLTIPVGLVVVLVGMFTPSAEKHDS